jgi:hypothetical protein
MSTKLTGDKSGAKLKRGEGNSDTVEIQEIQNEINSVITLEMLTAPKAVLPITLQNVPLLVRDVWQYMRFLNTADFQRLDTEENYEVFLKCVLVLCQGKLAYAHKHRLGFKSQLHKLMDGKRTQSALIEMTATLPLPIAILLDSIGITKFCGQSIVPVIATLKSNEKLSGAINFFPIYINKFVRKLRKGVAKGSFSHTLADRLKVLTHIEWEDAHSATSGEKCHVEDHQSALVRLTRKSYKSLRYPRKWVRDAEVSLFKKICLTLQKTNFVKESKIMSGFGTRTQLVQLRNSNSDDTADFYIMENTAKLFLRLAPAFGFGHHDFEVEEVSRYLGSPEIAFRRGRCNPNMARKILCSEHYMQLLDETKPAPPSCVLTTFSPITFRNIPAFVRQVWKEMSHIGGKRFKRYVTENNYEIFLKCVLVMCQAKLVCAHQAMPIDEAECFNLMYESVLSYITSMASNLPEPIAVMLDSIGITRISYQDVVPVIAKLKNNPELSGAINFLPADINLLIDKLRNGVVKGGLEHTFGKKLQVLTNVEWEDVPSETDTPQTQMIRLTERSYDSLCYPENWITREQCQLFKGICDSFSKDMQVCNFKSGQGAQSQLVQFLSWKPGSMVDFYVMDDVYEDQLRLAAAFGFGHHDYEVHPTSRFVGSPETAYKRGVCSQSEASSWINSLLPHSAD